MSSCVCAPFAAAISATMVVASSRSCPFHSMSATQLLTRVVNQVFLSCVMDRLPQLPVRKEFIAQDVTHVLRVYRDGILVVMRDRERRPIVATNHDEIIVDRDIFAV